MIYLTLFFEFFKMGLFTFGGGMAMIPLVEETVLKYGWMTESQFYNVIGLCESTPGPIAINMATYVGSVQGGLAGSLVATLGVVLPSFLIILLIASVMKTAADNRYFKGFVKGVQPVVIGLILSTGIYLLVKALGFISVAEWSFSIVPCVILIILTGTYFLYKKLKGKKLTAIQLIVLSAVLGIVVSVLEKHVI